METRVKQSRQGILPNLRTARGFAVLLYSYLVVAFLLTFSAATLMLSSLDARHAERALTQQQAFWAAEAGIDQAGQWLNARSSPPTCPGFRYPCNLTLFGGSQTFGNGSYSAVINLPASNANSSVDRYEMTVTATTAGVSVARTVAFTLQTESFARFAWFENHDQFEEEDDLDNWFITGATVGGPFHSNGQLHVWGGPVFEGPVSTVAKTVDCWHGCPRYDTKSPARPNDYPDFHSGITLGADAISMPNPSLDELRNNASLVVSGDTTIALAGTSILVNGTPYAVESNPVVFVKDGDLKLVGGELDGQLTLGTDEDIIIFNHVRYACNPEDAQYDADGRDENGQVTRNDDLAGLVAKGHVRISDSAPANLTIQASIMAVKNSFELQNNTRVPPKGKLHVFGGIIQNWIGITGWFDPETGQYVNGYREDYWYDERLLDLAPPYFPTTGRYQAVLWQDR